MKPQYHDFEDDQNKQRAQNTSIHIPQPSKITSNLPNVQSETLFQHKKYSKPSKMTNPSSFNEDFVYYETENYKNYKYKLYNIDISEIERKRLQGKKILISDYNNPWRNLEEKRKKAFFKIKGRGESPVQRNPNPNKSYNENNKLGLMNKINKLSMDLRIENSKKETQNLQEKEGITEEKKENAGFLPALESSRHKFQKQDPFQLFSRRLMGLIKKKKLELPNLNLTSTNNNSSVQIGSEDGRKIYRKKIGGGFSLAVKKGRLQNMENNKSVIIDQSPRQEERKSKATISPNEQIIQIIKSRKLKKAKTLASNAKFKSKSSKNSYDEYCHFVRITQKALKIGKKSLFISF